MGHKRLGVEQIIQKLHEAELELARGQTVAQLVKKLGVVGPLRTMAAKMKQQRIAGLQLLRAFGQSFAQNSVCGLFAFKNLNVV